MKNKGIHVRIQPDLMIRFKMAVAKNGDTITGLVIKWVTEYINKSEKENDKWKTLY